MSVFSLLDKSQIEDSKPKLSLVSSSKSWIQSVGLILVVLISLGFFSRMLLSAMIVQRQSKIDNFSDSISELDSTNRSLMFDIAQLVSTNRIMRIALAEPDEQFEGLMGLGMIVPEITTYLDPLSSANLEGWQGTLIASLERE